ncbi:MAG: methyltransferase [Cocleimonas sp.]
MGTINTNFGRYKLQRLPLIKNDNLRAWDAADELLLQTLSNEHSKHLQTQEKPILIINDAFGALSTALNTTAIHSWSDSYLSHLATQHNLQLNQITAHIKCIPVSDEPQGKYDLVIIKIPKTLALLEDQLCRLKPFLSTDSIIISAAMSKHIHTSTLKLFDSILGTTTTSRATKKARLIFTKNDRLKYPPSPYPKTIEDDKYNLTLVNHANVFSGNKLDIGTRFLIENLENCPPAKHIVDLGCGNGALGIMMKRHQPKAYISFIDESYSAITSAKVNFKYEYQNETYKDASFYISNSFQQFTGDKPNLILCNPPFHQEHSIADHIAWQMIKQSYQQLTSNGEIWVIGNRHLAYHVKLKKVFGNCKTIASNKKFVISVAQKT